MIAHYQYETVPKYGQSKRAHAEAIEQEQQSFSDKINQVLAAKPAISFATAVGIGLALGWLVKRKEW